MLKDDNTKIFDKWNEIKKNIQKENFFVGFKQRDIFYMKMGQNIGYEQNGKGESFVRPVVIIKRITNNMFIGVPLSSQIKKGDWFYKFEFNKNGKPQENIAIIPQIRMFSSKRLLNKIGKIQVKDFEELRVQIKNFI